MSASPQSIIEHTRHWLETVVIDLQLCPFAKPAAVADSIHYCVNEELSTETRLQALIAECRRLDQQTVIETTLFICPDGLRDFDDFLDFLSISEALLHAQGYEGIYQLASFHPDYCFDGLPVDDASHYTNRSPYPMLHLLRERSLEQAIERYPNPERIPERNIALTRSLGKAKLKALLSACYLPNNPS